MAQETKTAAGANGQAEEGKENKEKRDRLARGRYRLDVPDHPFGERAQQWILEHNVEHLYGPREVDYEIDELVVLCQVRNGRSYVEPFMEHYASLGVKHMVFLDNGSTDGTVEALKDYENVTVLSTGLPYKSYNVAMKRYLIERFGRGRWTLYVDIDELFEYPYSDVVDLKALLGYLNENSYTAVVSYMLDMFPEKPLSEEDPLTEYAYLKESHRFYDLSDIRAQSYHDVGDIGNVLANEEIKILRGGVQQRVFYFYPLLTKHPLVFLDEKLRPMDLSDHWAGNARVADFTGILLHYKLSANLYKLVRREVEERRYVTQHGKYDMYIRVLEKNPDLLIKSDTSKELRSVNDLVGSRIVTLSRQYMRFVEDEEKRKGSYSEEGRSERLLDAFFNTRAEVSAVMEELEYTRWRKSAMQKQMLSIRSSTSWKVFAMLIRLNTGVRGVLARLRYGVQGGISRAMSATKSVRKGGN